MRPPLAPPRVASDLLKRCLPPGMVGESILGDLRQEFEDHRRTTSGISSRVWYWRETVRLIAWYVWHRARERRSRPRDALAPNWRRGLLTGAVADLRYAGRVARRSPGFTVVAVLTLALGIGANTAIYSIVDGVLVRQLPFADPDRLVRVWSANRETGDRFLESTFADLLAFRDQNSSFASVSGFSLAPRHLNDQYGEPTTTTVARVSGSLFQMLGASPALGRDFQRADHRGTQRVAILSYGLWRERYGGSTDVLGEPISIRGQPYTVVGVMPPTYAYPRDAELWRPFTDDEYQDDDRELHVVARLRPTVTYEQATQDVRLIAAHLQDTPENENITAWVQPMHAMLVRNVRTLLLALLGAVGLVLLIACANIANLLLARATARQREIAIRSALGASRSRLVRQLLAESAMLAVLGGAAGAILGQWALGFIVSVSPSDTPRLLEVTFDLRVAAVMAAVTLGAGLLFGVLPALLASREGGGAALGGGRGGIGTSARHRTQQGLVVAEVATSTLLVIAAGLTIVSFGRQLYLDRGFETTRTLTVPVDPPGDFESDADVRLFFDQLRRQAARIPGVEAVTLSTTSPMDPLGLRTRIRPATSESEENSRVALVKVVAPDFFETLRIDILAGRGLTIQDDENGSPVAVVNEAFVNDFLGSTGRGPIGQVVESGLGSLEVIGVNANLTPAPTTTPQPTMYLSFPQVPVAGGVLIIRATEDPLELIPALRALVWDLDSSIPLNEISTLEHAVARSVASPRFMMLLLILFASLAVSLAAVGVYGVLAYSVSQRTRELGLRQALGAARSTILAMIVRQGLTLAALGIAIGSLAAVALTRLLRSLLYGVSPTDPATFGAVALILALVALAACVLPARRAMRIDPVDALRSD